MSAGYLDIDCVKYVCSCGLLKTIKHLYFCRYCSSLRCNYCVSHEVDVQFCGKCCENLPSAEARAKKNKCANCFVCPSCFHELSVRASMKVSQPQEDAKGFKKTYYLSCLCCRWSSRDIGLPDQIAATGGWPKRDTIHGNRIREISNMYKTLRDKEKQNNEYFNKRKKGKLISYSDLSGITAATLRKRIGLHEEGPLLYNKNIMKSVEPSKAVENVDDFNDEILTKQINLLEITTVDQRLRQPDLQPDQTSMLFPIQKNLSFKCSARCRKCEHNVSKPEYNPNSCKFKIQLFALYHIPEIRIVTVQPLRAGKSSELILKFTNPTQHQTTVSFLPFKSDDSQTHSELKLDDFDTTISHLVSQLQICETFTHVDLPTSSFILPQRDDAAEYDDFNEAHNIQDDKKLVVWRKSNKAFVKLVVKPDENILLGSDIVVGFTISHVYTNTISSAVENKKPQKFNHCVKVVLNLGKSVGCE